ncbi:hypothetical protein AC578_7501 [Pseudocercospora eumusae]|uniref:Uncharacterized protein n=1 Tax=Pseudocercospora eumusae TaxID=321146 RepID=A0A139GVA4_9PEZI|nr:hypothetical protein AC578_7501 [Pseudocercospora eumusae]
MYSSIVADFKSGAQPEIAMRKGITRLLKEAKDQNLDETTSSIFLGSAVEWVVNQINQTEDNKTQLYTTLSNKATSLSARSIGRGILQGMAEVLGGETVDQGGHKDLAQLLTRWKSKLKAGKWDMETLTSNFEMSQSSTYVAVVNASSNQLAKAVKGLWTKKASRDQQAASPALDVEAQIDDVFLVLALIGEALIPLSVFDDAYYQTTFFEVQTAIASCSHQKVQELFEKLADELKYLVTAGLTICAVFAPMHVYRGFGACVFGDWNWGCPDAEFLGKKVKKETSMFSKKPDPQPNRLVLLAFDRALQVLQVKPMAFLAKRPSISSFAEQQPRYGPRPKKEIKDVLSDCEDFAKELDKRGHPAPPGQKISSWGMPWAGWTSTFSCQMTKDWELVLSHQMDAGRLLHAFLCRGSLNLHPGQLITLPPATPAESLVCWLANMPGFTHKIIGWDAFMTSEFEKKVGKKMKKKIGHYPLPSKYVIRDPTAEPADAVVSPRASMPALLTRSRTTSSTITPPPYSPALSDETIGERTYPPPEKGTGVFEADGEGAQAGPSRVAELPTREPSELPSTEIPTSPTAPSPVRHSASVPPPSKPVISPPPQTPPNSATVAIRRKPPPSPTTNGASLPRHATFPSMTTTNETTGSGPSANGNAPPPRPPKVPLELDSTTVSSSSIAHLENARHIAVSPMQDDLSAHYLNLLNAVAQGTISPQQLQEVLKHGAPIPSLTAEPQELESIPRPPKFAGVTIPPGEMRSLSQSNIHQ